MGPCTGWPRSGRNDLLLNFCPQAFFRFLLQDFSYFFMHCFLCWAPTNWTPRRGYHNLCHKILFQLDNNFIISLQIYSSVKDIFFQIYSEIHYDTPITYFLLQIKTKNMVNILFIKYHVNISHFKLGFKFCIFIIWHLNPKLPSVESLLLLHT